MKKSVFTIDITSWTASFRYPNIISGFQPTLEVPPLSTILGLVNAAAGQYLQHEKLELAYYFQFEGKAVDLETIYQIESNKGKPTNNAKSNVVRREFLFDNFLRIYTDSEKLVEYFRKPFFPLVLGRMNDLATVEKIAEIELSDPKTGSQISGQIVPLNGNFLAGTVQALPVYFTDEIPRNNLGTKPYSIISCKTPTNSNTTKVVHDASIGKKGVDIYFHSLDFSKF
ncbi:MAG: type I-B CRISPR-associated protein Cas5 [Saprospiraceae bacterium]|nr:type I-B CRISPR-associated protein Cas5 [Saprospiraceae bacterium]